MKGAFDDASGETSDMTAFMPVFMPMKGRPR